MRKYESMIKTVSNKKQPKVGLEVSISEGSTLTQGPLRDIVSSIISLPVDIVKGLLISERILQHLYNNLYDPRFEEKSQQGQQFRTAYFAYRGFVSHLAREFGVKL